MKNLFSTWRHPGGAGASGKRRIQEAGQTVYLRACKNVRY